MKPFPPVLREKHRYLAYEVVGERRFSADEALRGVWGAVADFLGTAGLAETGFRLMGFDEKAQAGIVRVNAAGVLRVRAALALLANINKYRALIRIVRVYGTLKKARGE